MRRFVHRLWLLVFLTAMGVGAASGQKASSYHLTSGNDSTLWVDMSDAQMYTPPTREVPIGFDFFFCGMFYRRVSVSYYGLILFEDVVTDNFNPYTLFENYPPPLMDPYLSYRTISPVYMKTVGVPGTRKFVIELRVQVANESQSGERPIQVQLSEHDGSVLYLYGDPLTIPQNANFQIGFCGVDSTTLFVSMQEHAVTEQCSWNSNFKDWPGYYRYYRFTPDTIDCCSHPFDVEIESVRARQVTLSWEGSVYQSGFEVHYRPIGGVQAWNVATTTINRVVLSNLEPESEYEYIVYSICGNGCKSKGIKGRFITLCEIEDENQIIFYDLEGDGVECRISYFSSQSTHEEIVDYGPESEMSRHTVHSDTSELDPRTNNLLHTVPPGHCHSVRLGNWRSGAERESIIYHIKVDTNKYDLLILRYAIVEEDPSHEETGQPKFILNVLDSNNNTIDECYYANFVSGLGDVGWNRTENYIVWRDWTAIGVDLTPLHGQNIQVQLDNYDCGHGGHYGYAYFTLDSGKKRIMSANCGSSETNTFYAPEGFSYRWYREDNPSQTLSTSSSLTVTQEGVYKCRASFLTGGSNCGFTLTTFAGSRYPKASFTADSLDSCGFAYEFKNSSCVARDEALTQLTSESCEQYLWRVSDGTTSTATNLVHSFDEGTYTVELVAMLANGQCRDSVSRTITVNKPKDTIADTFCIGGCYYFASWGYYQPGQYIIPDGCWTHHLQLEQTQYFYEDIEVLACESEGYMMGDSVYDAPGVYDVHLRSVDGCDSSYTLHLSLRPRLSADYEIERVCSESPYYYLVGEYSEAPPEYAEAGSVAFVGADSLLYRWSAASGLSRLPYLDSNGKLHFDASWDATYYLQIQYLDSPACPETDTIELQELKALIADLEVTPTWLSYDNLDVTAMNRCRFATSHRWLVDGVDQGEDDPVFHFVASPDVDTVRIGIAASNDACADTAEKAIPVLRYLLMFPNVFTPNLGTNSRFGPIGFNVTDYELWVFDRRGALVFHSTAMEDTWDGTSDGRPCRQEAYAYICHYTTPTNDRLTATGVVTLLR